MLPAWLPPPRRLLGMSVGMLPPGGVAALVALALAICCCLRASDGAVASSSRTLAHGGVSREYAVMAPEEDPPTGLVIYLHGLGGTGASACSYGGLSEVVETVGAVVACPSARAGVDGSNCWKAFESGGYCFPGEHECNDDVEFIAALIAAVRSDHALPDDGRVIVAGFSNGGSMAYRVMCERSELIGGIVVVGQAYFDPYVGIYDNDGPFDGWGYGSLADPTNASYACRPKHKRPFQGLIGLDDEYYGMPPVRPGFEGVANWKAMSRDVLGCESDEVTEVAGRDGLWGNDQDGGEDERVIACYECASCRYANGSHCTLGGGAIDVPPQAPSFVNRMCSVTNLGHDASVAGALVSKAFTDFFLLRDGGEDGGLAFEWVTSDGLAPSEMPPASTCDHDPTAGDFASQKAEASGTSASFGKGDYNSWGSTYEKTDADYEEWWGGGWDATSKEKEGYFDKSEGKSESDDVWGTGTKDAYCDSLGQTKPVGSIGDLVGSMADADERRGGWASSAYGLGLSASRIEAEGAEEKEDNTEQLDVRLLMITLGALFGAGVMATSLFVLANRTLVRRRMAMEGIQMQPLGDVGPDVL